MKKFLSIMLAAMLAFSAVSVTTISAFAKSTTVASPEKTTASIDKIGQVNGKDSDDVSYVVDPADPTKITFTYTGDGDFTRWEFPGMVEGQDYEIVSEDGDTITIQLLGDYDGKVIANAIVEFDSETTTKVATTAKKSKSNESPDTGAAAAAGIALAGAGAAVLLTLKKKQDAE